MSGAQSVAAPAGRYQLPPLNGYDPHGCREASRKYIQSVIDSAYHL